jgi:hypothetical protein
MSAQNKFRGGAASCAAAGIVVALVCAVQQESQACPPESMAESEAEGPLRVWETALARSPRKPRNPLGPSDPSEVGQWLPPQKWPVVAIHAVMLPTGKVLHFTYPETGGGTLWDPVDDSFEEMTADTDLFCSGHSFLPDGLLYVAGGKGYDCPYQGHEKTYAFDPFAEEWLQLEDMADGRWYPTTISLGDGRVAIFAGNSLDCQTNDDIEVFTPGAGLQHWADYPHPLYPRMHLLSDGRIARVSTNIQTLVYDMEADLWTLIGQTNYRRNRTGSSSVYLPGATDQLMVIGGGPTGVVTETCEIIDFGDSDPAWRFTGSMHFARRYANAVILPDQAVLVVGGGLTDLYMDPVYTPELFDPDSETWTMLPDHVHPRMYHSTAILLPDGRVVSAGQDYGDGQYTAEIYEPAYLFRGERPTIDSVESNIAYDQTFDISTPNADDIDSVVLIAPGATTHAVNMTQRLVDLEFTKEGDSLLHVRAPEHGNLAQPGYYMVFIVDDDGVPSVAAWTRLAGSEPAILAGLDVTTGQVTEGDLDDMRYPDGECLQTISGFGRTFIDLHHMQFTVTGAAFPYRPQVVDLAVESWIDQPAGRQEIRVLNVGTGAFDLVRSDAIGQSPLDARVDDLPAKDYWNPDTGEVVVGVKHIVFVPIFAFRFDSYIDRVAIDVR